MNTHTAYVGLGSNLNSHAGRPEATLIAAITRLGMLGEVAAQSSFYDTDPVGYANQPNFVNAAIVLRTKLMPLDLLRELLAIEREFGRDRGTAPPKGPRTLDLDLLFVDDAIINHPQLILPHPGIAERRFVLAPLAEIAPRLVHPMLRKTIESLLQELPDDGEHRIHSVKLS